MPAGTNPLLQRLAGLLPEDEPAVLAAELVRLPSENPPGDEAPCLELLADRLDGWGWALERVLSPAGRLNLAAHLEFGRPGPWLALNGHLDVVPAGDPAAWSAPPYAGEIRDGRLHGRGAADMKAGVAALVWGARLAQLSGRDLAGGLLLHLVSDEENGGAEGSACLVEPGRPGAAAVIVAEPTGLNLVVAQRGALWTRLRLLGRAGHGALSGPSGNAITALGPLLTRLAQWRPAGEHPLLGGASLNPGRVRGGRRVNQAPDLCELELDLRFAPGQDPKALRRELAELAAEALAGSEVRCELEPMLLARPYVLDPDDPWLRLVAQCATEARGQAVKTRGIKGMTDARFYVERWGIPAAVLGPGRGAQTHGADEFVDISQVRQAALIYALAAIRFLGGSEG